MSSLKSKLTIILTFVFTVIILLTISSLVMVYQLGMNSQPLAQADSTNIENPFEGFTPILDSPVEQLKKLLASGDSLNTDELLGQFDSTSTVIEKRILTMEAAAETPETQAQIAKLKTDFAKYKQQFEALKTRKIENLKSTFDQLRHQLETVSVDVKNLYFNNWQDILSYSYPQTETKYMVAAIFAFTIISLLLMIGSGVYSTKAVGKSERKLTETLRAKNEEKRQFIAYVSHELKTSVSAINLSTKILKNKRTGTLNDDQQEVIKYIQDQTKRLLKMVNETKEFSKKKN